MPLYALDEFVPAVADPARVYIAPGAHVMGQVTLGLDVTIWFNASLRADNEPIVIGDGSNIQEGAVLHVDPGFPIHIGENVTVGHKAVVHGCSIGAGSLIGMGAIILNGAKIGKGCLVGAGALITEGKEFPDYSLIVGQPARVIRTLDDKAAARIAEGAARYVARGRQYAGGLREIAVESAARR